jgi:oligopeptidase B
MGIAMQQRTSGTPSSGQAADAAPPQAARRPHAVGSPWGERIDDYYWLRDDERKDPEVLGYLAAENQYAERVLAPLAEQERQLFEELGERLEPLDASVPVWHDGYWYYWRFEPGREYRVHARRAASMQSEEQIVLDENELAQRHAYFDLGDWEVSPDGRLVAYTCDTVGRRQYEIFVREIATGRDLPDRVANAEAELVWAADGRTLVYVEKDPHTLLSVRVRAHRLGEAPAQDRLLYEEADSNYYLGIGKSRSERYLLLCCSSTEQCQWWFAERDDPELRLRSVLPREPDHEYDVDHRGGEFVLRTNWQAPNFRIVRVPVSESADKRAWTEIVPHDASVYIERFEVAAGHLAVNERSGGLLRIRLREWSQGADATADTLLEPEGGAGLVRLVPTPGIDSTLVRYEYTSLVTPRTVYEWDTARRSALWRKTQAVRGGFDSRRYATRMLTAPASDGAAVPVSIAYRRDTPLDGTAPVFQTGYGAYGHCFDPEFRANWVSLMDRGFVVAIAHVRGGQELGRSWYDSGRLAQKMNSFTDFICATDLLVREGIGSPARICAQGGSAGGLLVAAVANLAPERYRAIVAHVPFVDVLTTMLDESIPLTSNEYDQWGDPRRQRDYQTLLCYSPYDNVRPQAYPALLVFTGLWDSQVQYFEPAKWVARLRATRTDNHALLLCTDLQAGHGGKSGRYQRLHETAREVAFLLWQVGAAAAGARAETRDATEPAPPR